MGIWDVFVFVFLFLGAFGPEPGKKYDSNNLEEEHRSYEPRVVGPNPPGVPSACSVMVIIDASQALDPGSIPGRRKLDFFYFLGVLCIILVPSSEIRTEYARVAQLGERQTKGLKVLGSIPSVGSVALLAQFGRAWVY